MRRIVAHMEMSLDGVVDHPERWAHEYFAPDMLEAATSQMPETGTVLFGRRTYEEFAAVWPERPADDPFAGFLNSSLKVVVSRTLGELPWGPAERIDGRHSEHRRQRTRLEQSLGAPRLGSRRSPQLRPCLRLQPGRPVDRHCEQRSHRQGVAD